MGIPSDSLRYAMKVRLGLIVESPKRRARVGRVTTGKRAFALARMSIHADGETLTATLPIRTYSTNKLDTVHWGKRAKEAEYQRLEVKTYLRGKPLPPLPVVVTLTRIGPKAIDSDNAVRSLKACRDELATLLGVDDGDRSKVSWEYAEPEIGAYGVRVEIRKRVTADHV